MYLALSHTTVVQTCMCTYTCTIHAFSKHTELIGQISVPSQGGHGCICTRNDTYMQSDFILWPHQP